MFVLVCVRPQWHWSAMEGQSLHFTWFVAHVQTGKSQGIPEVRLNGLWPVLPPPVSRHKVLSQAPTGASGDDVYIHPAIIQTLATPATGHE